MCTDKDEKDFQDITKHRYFNTNNLLIRLDKLKLIIDKFGEYIPLPMIKNMKTVDPKDDSSQKMIQLEIAMGAAIEMFAGATSISIPRTRFAPVKKTDDLITLRSDAYSISDTFVPVLNPKCEGKAPIVSLDKKVYKQLGKFEAVTSRVVPSLVKCTRLTVKGAVNMSVGCRFVGEVTLTNNSNEPKTISRTNERHSHVAGCSPHPNAAPPCSNNLVMSSIMDLSSFPFVTTSS